MALITFDDKDKTQPTSDPKRKWRDEDANEVKTVVNENATRMMNIRDDIASMAQYPDSGGSGDGGAIKKWDAFPVPESAVVEVPSKGGGTEVVPPGYFLVAMVDAPGQDAFNWRIM